MINVAREQSPETKYLCGDFLSYNFNNIKFEGIFAKAVLHLFTMKAASNFIKKIEDLLVDKGLCYLSLFVRDRSNEGFRDKFMGGKKFRRYTKDWIASELEILLENSSLRLIRTFNLPHGTMIKWSGILKK